MARHHTCNACNKRKKPNELKRIRLVEAFMPGVEADLDMKQDKITEGEVCTDCASDLHEVVGDESSKLRLSENSRPEPKKKAPTVGRAAVE